LKGGFILKKIYVCLPEDIYEALVGLASRRKESISAIARKMLTESIAVEAAKDGIDAVTDAVRRAMRDILKPTEDRLAKLAAKAAVAAATAMYLNTQCISDLGKNNALELYQMARTKAVAYLREKDEEE
jgi:rRNA-processing protein FCF1